MITITMIIVDHHMMIITMTIFKQAGVSNEAHAMKKLSLDDTEW